MRRGASKEIYLLFAIVLGIVLAQLLSNTLQPWFERLARMVLFVAKGGLARDDPTVLWQEVTAKETLFGGSTGLPKVQAVIFFLVAAIGVLVAEYRLHKRSLDRNGRAMGTAIGVINGTIAAVYLFPRLVPQEPVSFQVETGDVTQLLTAQINLAHLIVLGLFVIIAFGVYASSR